MRYCQRRRKRFRNGVLGGHNSGAKPSNLWKWGARAQQLLKVGHVPSIPCPTVRVPLAIANWTCMREWYRHQFIRHTYYVTSLKSLQVIDYYMCIMALFEKLRP
jgi:hypothetical protein